MLGGKHDGKKNMGDRTLGGGKCKNKKGSQGSHLDCTFDSRNLISMSYLQVLQLI